MCRRQYSGSYQTISGVYVDTLQSSVLCSEYDVDCLEDSELCYGDNCGVYDTAAF